MALISMFGRVLELMPFPVFLALSSNKGAPVAYCWWVESQSWDFRIRRKLFDREVPRFIKNLNFF